MRPRRQLCARSAQAEHACGPAPWLVRFTVRSKVSRTALQVSPTSREASRSFLPAISSSICDAGGGGGIRPDVKKRRTQPITPTPAGLRLAKRSAPRAARIKSRTSPVTITTTTANSNVFDTDANTHTVCRAPNEVVAGAAPAQEYAPACTCEANARACALARLRGPPLGLLIRGRSRPRSRDGHWQSWYGEHRRTTMRRRDEDFELAGAAC